METAEGSTSSSSSQGGRAADAEAGTVVTAARRFSLDVSAGCGGRRSTLLDEYERLAFEAQLDRAMSYVLRRCYSEPSPVRFVVHQTGPSSDAALTPGLCCGGADRQCEAAREAPRRERAAAGPFWRLHEAVARLLQVLEPVFRWLRSAWERRRRRTEQQQAAARHPPPPTLPRVQLIDYLRR